MQSVSSLFFDLLQSSVTGKPLDATAFNAETHWPELFQLSKEQTLLGVTFSTICSLPKECAPQKELLFKWLAISEKIKVTNKKIEKRIEEVEAHFAQRGFKSCILKGQGMAQLYPHPECRMPGDIDVWVDGNRKGLLQLARYLKPDCSLVYHHIDYRLFSDVEVELHFHPSWMYSPFHNRKLQRFFKKEARWDNTVKNDVTFHVPTSRFNLVFILVHIYRHLFQEGIGLRQMMDYYYVLISNIKQADRDDAFGMLKSIGMARFSGATMWVLQKVFALDRKYMLCEPIETEGRFLLDEIMLAGNFGQYDSRIRREKHEKTWHVFMRRTIRNMHFVKSYPSEVFWSPIWKIWHWVWRKTYAI